MVAGSPAEYPDDADLAEALVAIREDFGSYFACYPPAIPYRYGPHTYALIDTCQRASDAVKAGRCYYGIIQVPIRHGKSDAVSRRLPAWHIQRCPEHEVILTGYSGELAVELSLDARRAFAESAREFGLTPGRMKDNSWGIEGHKGKVNAVGFGGSATGRGANLLIVEDYCKNRQEAESETHRRHVWDSFRNDFWTRLAPAHAVIVAVTPWHVDDLVGRIKKEMKDNPDFPRFEIQRFPAWDDQRGWLFPERFSEAWYTNLRAMGRYAWASLGQCDPQVREGNLLRADLVKFIREDQLPEGLVWIRGWDIASTEKERVKDDPDFSVGTLAAYHKPNRALYVRDVRRGQWSTLARDRQIIAAAREDGPAVTVKIEAVAGYVDTYKRVKAELAGEIIVKQCTPATDKVARASVMEPCFESGNVYVVCDGHPPAWFAPWQNELIAFPSGSHDDQADSLVVSVYDALTKAETTFGTL